MVLDSYDHPHIAYYYNTELRYAYCTGSSWIFETVDGEAQSYYVTGCRHISLDLDSNGYPHISYSVPCRVGHYGAIFVKHAYFDGNYWIIETVSEGLCRKPYLALDSQNNPHITYTHDALWGGDLKLRYAHYNGSSWLIKTIDRVVIDGSQSIALDSHGSPHIAYSKGQNLFHTSFNGTSWVIETVAQNSSHYVSMAIDPLDNIHIGYIHEEWLKYAYYGGTSWSTQTLVDTRVRDDDRTYDNSIALNSLFNPYIVYIDSTSFDHPYLKLAYYNDTSWNVQTIDGGGDVARKWQFWLGSIALDSRDYPQITFVKYVYEDVNKNMIYLKHARAGRAGIYPIASFTYSPSEPIGGETVSFDASTSYDPDGTIVSYTWNFGDGINATETDPTTSHTYVAAGNHAVVLAVTDNDTLTSTARQFITVVKLYSTISVSLSSSTSFFGFKVDIDGNLTCNDVVGVSRAPLLISYSVTGGESWNDITLVSTTSDGSYSAIWMPSATGNYLVRATWAGNATYIGTTAIINLAVIPFEERHVFSVMSNSTVSALVFNSTSRELSFTVTGPPDTTGYVNVYVAKGLVEHMADVKVYLDSDQLSYKTISLDDSWLLHFTYVHSIHKITISLGGISTPFIETPLGKVLIYGLPITAMAILILFFSRKPLHKLLASRKTLNSEREKPRKG